MNRNNLELAVYGFIVVTVGITLFSIIALIPILVFNMGLNPFRVVFTGFIIGLTLGIWVFIIQLLFS